MRHSPDDMQTVARAAYEAWRAQQDDDADDGWAELPAPEQDAWRRAARLRALIGEEAMRHAPE